VKKINIIIKKIKVITFLLIIAVAMIPTLLITLIYGNAIKSYLNKAGTSYVERERDAKVKNIKAFYETMKLQLNSYSTIQGLGFIDNNTDGKMNYEGIKSIQYIDNIYILNADFNLLNSLYPDKVNEHLITVLKEAKFSKHYYVSNFYMKDNKEFQFVFFKLVENGEIKGYTAFEINNSFFEEFMESNSDLNVDIYNDNFTIIASTIENRVYTNKINEYTKRMLNGYTSTESVEGIKTSYTFIDLENTSLYMVVTKNESEIYAPFTNSIMYIFIIFLLCLVFSVVVAVRFIRFLGEQMKKEYFDSENQKIYEQNKLLIPRVENIIELLDISVTNLEEIKIAKDKLSTTYDQLKGEESGFNDNSKDK